MSIVTLRFFIFTGFLLAEYWLCPAKARWVVLLAGGGYFFLACTAYDPGVCAVFVLEALLTWLAALGVRKLSGERAKALLTGLAVTALVAVMILYKDLGFFISSINSLGALLGRAPGLQLPQWLAPFGISYYTLILTGYLLDVRWETVEQPQKNPLKLLLFAGYFPQLTSGPFSRYNDLSPALLGNVQWDARSFRFGLQRFLWGLCKKLIVADRLAVAVAALYDGAPPRGVLVPVAALLYIAQLYVDFSGCMDIVIGISQLFGIPLAENFCRPFSAENLSVFWRRWHMTLGFWLKDYLLYPTLKSGWMGRIRKFCKAHWGKRASREVPTYIGMFITWFCVGFWHGGSWKYIFGSGLFFFAMIAGGMLLKPVFRRLTDWLKIDTDAWYWKRFQRLRTACLFSASVSFDRYAGFTDGLRAWKSVLTVWRWDLGVLLDGTLLNLGLSGWDVFICAAGFAAIWCVSTLQERHGSVRELLDGKGPLLSWAATLVLLLAVLLLGRYGAGYEAAAFIYAGF